MRIVRTADGSDTIELPARHVTYHSMHGAVTESQHVFIHAGLQHIIRDHNRGDLRIFEFGFGTGLNAALTYQFAQEHDLVLAYLAIEPYPVPHKLVTQLNYPEVLGMDQDLFLAFHETSPDIASSFQLTVFPSPWGAYTLPDRLDLIYLDAFGPRFEGQPWDQPALEQMYTQMNPGGVLVTFCAQGAFKRHLKACGFHVEALPGPPGKREMTRATKV